MEIINGFLFKENSFDVTPIVACSLFAQLPPRGYNVIDHPSSSHPKTTFSHPSILNEISLFHFNKSTIPLDHHSTNDAGYVLLTQDKSVTPWHTDHTGTSVFYVVLKGTSLCFLFCCILVFCILEKRFTFQITSTLVSFKKLVWFIKTLISGTKIFYLVPPTEYNLRLFEDHLTKNHRNVFFAAKAEGACKVTVVEGEAIFVGPRWIHLVETIGYSVAQAVNFVHIGALDVAATCFRAERKSRMPLSHSYKGFVVQSICHILDYIR